jgi:hypothetical protein
MSQQQQPDGGRVVVRQRRPATQLAHSAIRRYVLKEKQIMQTLHLFTASRRWALGVVLAALVALAAVYTPVVLQETAGVDLTSAAYACGSHTGGGC